MLNLQTYDKDDAELIERSYQAIRNKSQLHIVLEGEEQKQVFETIRSFLLFPVNSTIILQNLFRINANNGSFYIALFLFDFGYPVNTKLTQSFNRKYHFQAVGFAKSLIDLGETVIQPETRTDKLFDRLLKRDIKIDGADKFNEKYYFVSNKKDIARKVFDSQIAGVISMYNNVNIITKGKLLFLGIGDELEANHCRQIEYILSSLRCLDTKLLPG